MQGFYFVNNEGPDYILPKWSSSVHHRWTSTVVRLDPCLEVCIYRSPSLCIIPSILPNSALSRCLLYARHYVIIISANSLRDWLVLLSVPYFT